MYKIVLEILNDDGDVVEMKLFKSMKALADCFQFVPYHTWRELYKYGKSNKSPRQLQTVQKEMMKRYRVLDNPVILQGISKLNDVYN